MITVYVRGENTVYTVSNNVESLDNYAVSNFTLPDEDVLTVCYWTELEDSGFFNLPTESAYFSLLSSSGT